MNSQARIEARLNEMAQDLRDNSSHLGDVTVALERMRNGTDTSADYSSLNDSFPMQEVHQFHHIEQRLTSDANFKSLLVGELNKF